MLPLAEVAGVARPAGEEVDPQDGQIVIDKGRKFLFEAGQWDDPASYVSVG